MKEQTISRRTVLGAIAGGVFGGAVATAATSGRFDPPPKQRLAGGALHPAALPQPDDDILLLNRISFGIRPVDKQRITDIGSKKYIDEQLIPDQIQDTIEKQVKKKFPTTSLDVADMNVEEERFQIALDLKAATLYRAVFSTRQLFEVLVEFWSDHFSVYHADGPVSFLKTVDDREVIRAGALGSFEDLLMASAKSPAMLYYLDNYANVAEGPNENYARELLELHTMGVDGGYSQEDVNEIARAFTGWTIDNRQRLDSVGTFVFVPGRHDHGSKTVLGQTIPPGGISEGEQVLSLLAGQRSTSEFIASKLVARFVSDDPPNSLVKKAAKTFRKTDGDISETVRTILRSKKLKKYPDAKIKRPFHFVASVLRCLDAEIDDAAWLGIVRGIGNMGHSPFGWPAPNGYPDEMQAWINTNGLMNRWNIGLATGANAIPGVRIKYDAMLDEAEAETAAEVVTMLTDRLLHRPLKSADRTLLEEYLAAGRGTSVRLSRSFIHRRLPGLVALIIDSPYFQYR